jgi:hypothetical protein
MVISADFEKQYFVKKILLSSIILSLCLNIDLSQYCLQKLLVLRENEEKSLVGLTLGLYFLCKGNFQKKVILKCC